MGSKRRISQSQPKAGAASLQPRQETMDTVFFWLLPVLLFLTMTAVSIPYAIGITVVFLVFSVGKGPMETLRSRLSPLALAVFLYAALCLVSGLWCHFGSYALRETIKTLTALSFFALLLVRLKKEHLRWLLACLAGVMAVISLLSIDGASSQLLARAFSGLMSLFGSSYPLSSMGYETGVRIVGIYNNANVGAGLIAFGLLLTLYLLRTEETPKGRLLAALALGIQSLAFLLFFSMGAMASFAVACLVYVICAGKGNRVSLFLLMLECVASALVCAFITYPLLGTSGAAGLLAVLMAPICGLLIWVLDRFVGSRVLAALEGRSRAVSIAGGALVALAVVYVLLAFNLTGGVTLDAQSPLSRAVYPDAGSYTVSYDGINAQVLVYSQNESELMMHTNTTLYEGSLSEAAFTVPEGSRVVWFVLSGDGELNSVTLSDGTALPLGYKLLPGFAANRLQGLWANQNFIQRLVFFRDGIKLWQASPILGWGIGGVEGQLTSVQTFYYESRYIHNQFIQIMDEAGILGLAAFVFLLVSALWLLRRRWKQGAAPILPMLAACLTMMTAHSLTEVVWSVQVYQTAAFIFFAVMVIFCWEPAAVRSRSRLPQYLSAAALWCVTAVFALLLAGTLTATLRFQALDTSDMTSAEFLSVMQKLDRLDAYTDQDYKVNTMGNALMQGGAASRGLAARCARELLDRQEYDACYNVAAYYDLPLRDISSLFAAMETGLEQERSNPGAWNSAFHLFRQVFEQLEPEYMDDFVSGVLTAGQRLDEANQYLMAPVSLDEANQRLLNCVRSLNGLSGEMAQAAIAAALA